MDTNEVTITDAIAFYAAILSTITAALSVRQWHLTGARLSLSVMARSRAFGWGSRDAEYLVLNVVNRGSRPTTLSMMVLFQFKSPVHRWLRRPYWSAIVPDPAGDAGTAAPTVLEPGASWLGMTAYDADLRARAKAGSLFVAIHGSHSSRSIMGKVRWNDDDR
jgi:hypothetical protein